MEEEGRTFGSQRVVEDFGQQCAHVRFTQDAAHRSLHWSAKDLFLAACVSGLKNKFSWNEKVQEKMMQGPTPSLCQVWQLTFFLSLDDLADCGGQLWISTHGLGAVLWHLFQIAQQPTKDVEAALGQKAGSLQESNVTKLRSNLLDLIYGLERTTARPTSPAGGDRIPDSNLASRRAVVPMVRRKDSHGNRLKKDWANVSTSIAVLLGIHCEKLSDEEFVPMMGESLAHLINMDPRVRAEALKHGLAEHALISLQEGGHEQLLAFLLEIKYAFACSWGMLLKIARKALLTVGRHYSICNGETASKIVTEVKGRAKRMDALLPISMTSAMVPGKGQTVGAAFDPMKRIEHVLCTESLRWILRFPKGKLVMVLTLDARELARRRMNTLVGIKFPTMEYVCNSNRDFFSLAMFSGKETLPGVLGHLKVQWTLRACS